MGFLNKDGLKYLWDKITHKIDTSIANLVNSAPETLDTLGELATALNENKEVIETLETIASGKADAEHEHEIADVSGLQDALKEKSNTGHNHYAQAITQGTLNTERLPTIPVSKGGTGATTVEGARTKLDVYSKLEVEDLLNNKPSTLIVSVNSDTEELSHSFEEVLSALEAGQGVLLSLYNGTVLLSPVFISEDKTYITFSNLEMAVNEDQYANVWINGCHIYSDGHNEIEFADLLTRKHPEIKYEDKDIIVALNYVIEQMVSISDEQIDTICGVLS